MNIDDYGFPGNSEAEQPAVDRQGIDLPKTDLRNMHSRNMHLQNMDLQIIDREIDAALARYAKSEPPAGLERRVLARLAEAERESNRSWRWWSALVLGTAAALAIVALWLAPALRGTLPKTPVTEVGAPPTMKSEAGATKSELVRIFPNPGTSRRSIPSGGAHTSLPKDDRSEHVRTNDSPRLDQFPSPRPLSEQEQILMSYVAAFPETAALVARVRAEGLKRDREEDAAEAANRATE